MKTRAFTKTYPDGFSLTMPELDLPEGRIIAVIGSNGSGKSTLARVLAGAERPDDGSAVLADSTVGWLPQRSYPFRLSVINNLLLTGGERERAQRLLSALGIEALADRRADRLSGGETARMALARILMRECALLILDEPTAAMDMEATLLAERLILDYREKTGCTVLLVTHSIGQARRIADEVLFLRGGCLAERGDTEQLLADPQREETRAFLDFFGK